MIRVLLVDDQELVRTGLRGILRSQFGFEIAGELPDGRRVAETVDELKPDVVLMDVRMPWVDGVQATSELRRRGGSPPVLALTTFDDDEVLAAMLRAGASGFILKGVTAEDLQRAVRVVAEGGAWLDPAVTGRVLKVYRSATPQSPAGDAGLDTLSGREREVLALIGQGKTNGEIAAGLCLGEGTVKTHINHVFAKLRLRDRAAAVVYAFDHDLVSPKGGCLVHHGGRLQPGSYRRILFGFETSWRDVHHGRVDVRLCETPVTSGCVAPVRGTRPQRRSPATATALQGLGFPTATAEWTGYDSDQPADGEQVHEAIIDLFSSQFGTATPSGAGSQAVLDSHGVVLSAGAQAGGAVPAGGSVIQGVGGASDWLAAHAIVGQRLAVSERVTTATGRNIPLTPGLSIASAAPNLVTDGRTRIDAVAQGVIDPADLSFNYAWAEIRQPRTIAGIDKSGRLMLVTVDGRQPGVSEGLTLTEEADLMESLGAQSAMNLDGGGSTAIAVNGTLVNHTSDATGERPDGDFVVVLPKR